MNYKSSAIAEIESLADNFKDYSLGQLLLAIIKRKPENLSISEWLYTVTDEDLYTEVERVKLIEIEEGFYTDQEIQNLNI